MNVSIDLQKGTTNLKTDEEDKMFTFANQNIQANEFMQGSSVYGKKAGHKFKPFESQDDAEDHEIMEDPMQTIEKLNTFSFKACNLTDEKSQNLYQEMKPDYKKQSASKTNKKIQLEKE